MGDLDISYRKETEMHMADLLSRAYLPPVKQDIVDTQEVWNVADTRSPTEVETEYVDMAESVPIQKLTLQEIKSATEVKCRAPGISSYYHTRLAREKG